jgi:hypothetical protein
VTDYTPLLSGSTFTFRAGEFIRPRDPLELCGPMQVCRAHAGPGMYLGVAGNGAYVSERVTVHTTGVIHVGPVLGDVGWGEPLAAGPRSPWQVMPVVPGAAPIGVSLTNAADGEDVLWIGRGPSLPGLPALPGRPGGGTGGGLWFGTAGETIPSLSPVVIYGVGNISRVPALSSASLVIGVNDHDVASGQIAVVHLVGPLMLSTAAAGITNGMLLATRAPGRVAAAGPDDFEAEDRRIVGVSLQNVSAGQSVLWVARH